MLAVVLAVTTGLSPAFAKTRRAAAITKGPQASITLDNADVGLTNHNDFSWDIGKNGILSGDAGTGATVDWTVTTTKTGPVNIITVNGFITVTNTGSAPATIGNIVVNLQHRCTPKSTSWGSVSVDVADAANGDAATSDKVVAAATQETTSKCKGADYTSTNGVGTFTENPGSGSLSFMDADNNTIWAITPEVSLAPGQTVNLLYQANFDATFLAAHGVNVGSPVRTETIVTFGNAGGRGGSGASIALVDIDGDGIIDCNGQGGLLDHDNDECWVRSVPARTSLELPAAQTTCNDSVTLSDVQTGDNPAVTSGDATFDPSTFSTDIGGGSGIQSISSSGSFDVSVGDVLAGLLDSEITNCANISSPDVTQQVQIGVDPNTLLPIYQTFTICTGIDQTACNSVDIPATSNPPEPPPTSPFCTYQQSLWGNPNNTGANTALTTKIGFPLTVGGSNEMTFTTPVAVQDYLPAGGTNGALTDPLLTNPTSTSAGHFGGSVLALELNVLSNPGFGDLTLCGLTSTEADFDGMTVNDVLSAANAVLGGAAISTSNPGDYNGYDALLQHLNVSYQQCNETGFAKNHLVSGSCP